MTEREKEYVTEKLIELLSKLIQRDSLDGVELTTIINYMGIINKVVYNKEEAIPYLKELCDKGLLSLKNGKYYPLG